MYIVVVQYLIHGSQKAKALHAMNDSGFEKTQHFMRWMIQGWQKAKSFYVMNDLGFAKSQIIFYVMNDCGSQKQSFSCDEWFRVFKSQIIACDEWFQFAKIKAFHAMNYSVFAKSQIISNDEWLRFAKTKHFMRWMILVRKNKSISCDEWYTFAKAKAFHAMNDSWITRIAKAKVFHAKKRITTSSLLNTNGCVTSDQCYLVKKVVIVEAENPIGWVEPKKPDLPRFLCTVYFL